MRRAVVLSALTAATLILGALTACGDDDPAPNYSSVSSTPTAPSTLASPTPTARNTRPGETSPTPYPDYDQNTAEGAQSFATYYVQTLDWVFATGDPSILEPFYASDCTTCQSRLTFLNNLFSDGTFLEGGRVTIKRGALVENDGRLGANFAVSTAVSVAQAVAVASDGTPTATDAPADQITLTQWLRWSAEGWQIVEERYG